MKAIKILIPMLCIALLFSGCGGFHLASSIDDLISPVAPAGADASVQSAMDAYCKGGYSVKIPAAGKYTTSYIFYDFDDDGQKEALAFYEPNDALGKIDMAVLEQSGENWQVIANIQGEGTDVYSVDFCDVNGDGKTEFLISWNMISYSTSHLMSVYKMTGSGQESKLTALAEPMQYSAYIPADLNNDGVQEVLFFSADQMKSLSASAALYSYKGDKQTLLGETRVDGHVSAYRKLQVGKADGKPAVYADAVKSDGASMLTELICWSDYYDSIVSPFYSYNTGLTADTGRDVMVPCVDMNGDGLLEIPTDAKLKGLPSQVRGVDWCKYKSSVLVHTGYSLAVQEDGYQMVLPDKQFKSVTVSYADKSHRLTVKSKTDKKTAFEVLPVLQTQYDANPGNYKDYTELLREGGYVYLAKCGNSADFAVTADPAKADFLYVGRLPAGRAVDDYLDVLNHAASLGLPLLCAGNDTSVVCGEDTVPAAGAVAEQYAVLGGRIITLGKPDVKIIDYALDGIDVRDRSRVLLIGDNLATDIKGANLAGLSAALVTKAVHVNFLGEGYIPDVAKTRELATNFDAYPDFIISNLRW